MGALDLVGLYALHMARPLARVPGSVFGKVMTAGNGVGEPTLCSCFILSHVHSECFESCRIEEEKMKFCMLICTRNLSGFLAGSMVRWNMTPTEMLGTFTTQFPGSPKQS